MLMDGEERAGRGGLERETKRGHWSELGVPSLPRHCLAEREGEESGRRGRPGSGGNKCACLGAPHEGVHGLVQESRLQAAPRPRNGHNGGQGGGCRQREGGGT